MTYIKLISESEYVYPYNINLIYSENPNYSFPSQITPEIFQMFSIFEVDYTEKPQVDYTKNVTEGIPESANAKFRQKWEIEDASQEEINFRISQKWIEIRKERNRELSSSDWTQVPDNNLSEQDKLLWQAYRQNLRDLTSTEENPFNINFPTRPVL
jgi:hypothetical protein